MTEWTNKWWPNCYLCLGPGPWFNIKMLSNQYRKSHCGDKMILGPSYLHNGISYTGKTTSLYWIRVLVIVPQSILRWIMISCDCGARSKAIHTLLDIDFIHSNIHDWSGENWMHWWVQGFIKLPHITFYFTLRGWLIHYHSHISRSQWVNMDPQCNYKQPCRYNQSVYIYFTITSVMAAPNLNINTHFHPIPWIINTMSSNETTVGVDFLNNGWGSFIKLNLILIFTQ